MFVTFLIWDENHTVTVQAAISSLFIPEIFTFGCCILLHIYPTGSLWCRRSQQSFNTSTRFYFPSHSLHVSAPTGHLQSRYTIGCFNGLFLIQWIRCTYATWCRDVTCCTSVPRLCIPNTCYVYNFYICIHVITCIGNAKSRNRCTAGNISASGRVRATDPLY
jgi:hypothetical protein